VDLFVDEIQIKFGGIVMVTKVDTRKLTELSRGLESLELAPVLKSFIQSLDLSEDEEKEVVHSLKMLPRLHLSPSALPKNAPSLIRMGVWR